MKNSYKRNKRGLLIIALLNCVVYGYPAFVFAKECFDKSPAVEKNDDIYMDQSVPKLSEKQYENLAKILKAAEGSWTGSMTVKECFGTKSSLTTKLEEYEVKAISELEGQLFELNLELYAVKSKTRKNYTNSYSLTKEYLSIDGRQTGIAEVLTTTATGASFYKRFRQTQAGKSGSFVKEVFNVFEASGREVAIKEYQYINGELVAESILLLN